MEPALGPAKPDPGDDYGFQPIVVFDGAGRFVTAVLRPAKRPRGREIAAHLRRLIRELRSH